MFQDKKPNDWTFDEFKEFMDYTHKITIEPYEERMKKKPIKTKFSSIEELEECYELIPFEEYLKESKKKYGC